MSKEISILQNEAVELLKELISIPSFSKEEDQTAGVIGKFLARGSDGGNTLSFYRNKGDCTYQGWQ